jgi:hypothetical protein
MRTHEPETHGPSDDVTNIILIITTIAIYAYKPKFEV